MNKIILAVLASLFLNGSAMAAPSVWGIPGGSRFDSVLSAMTERGCTLRLDLSAMDMGKRRETLFDGVFFDRPCSIRAEFDGDSLSMFQFFFLKKDGPTSQDVGDMLGNYSELSLKLRSKYGYERKVESHAGGETQVWSQDGVTITLSCDGRSITGHTTVLTYDFRGAKE
ncbi:MAG: hypothetical protein EOM02_04305 [Synergistales bacterium]|nr:hypothetical protein [Synergistales bacterium]